MSILFWLMDLIMPPHKCLMPKNSWVGAKFTCICGKEYVCIRDWWPKWVLDRRDK